MEEVRQSAAAREGALERELQTARELAQQTRSEAQRATEEIVRVREASARELADEKGRADARVEEVRAGLQAQLLAAQQLADERGQARDRLMQQLTNERPRPTTTTKKGKEQKKP